MKKQNISRKTVKDRIKEWMKTHQPWGMSTLDTSEKGPQLKPMIGDRIIEPPPCKSLEEFFEWIDTFEGDWYIRLDDDVDKDDFAEIETTTLDKSKGLPKKRKKKPKIWTLQYKWRSEEDFNKYPKHWLDRVYVEGWNNRDTYNFDSAQGCKLSILNSLRSDFFKKYIAGRDWRAFNTETKETIEFPNIENYYK